MVAAITIAELEAEMASRIAALDATAWANLPNDAWRESRTPLTAVEDTTAISHLAFSVSVESAPVLEDGQGGSGQTLTILAEFVVIFVYKIGETTQIDAYRNASRAASDVLRALLRPYALAHMQPRQIFKPGTVVNGFMPVEMRFQALFDHPI